MCRMGKGKLRFKGEKDATKKKKKKSKHSKAPDAAQQMDASDIGQRASTHASISDSNSLRDRLKNETAEQEGPAIQKGKGLIMSSGTVLMGHDTKFNSTLNPGDAILVQVPTTDRRGNQSTQEEMRVITIRLSDTSASISSAFSTDLGSPTPFQSIAKPRNVKKEQRDRDKKDKMTKEEMERSAFGTYKSSSGDGSGRQEFVYRERTVNGGYRIRRETVSDDVSRGDLLSMRAQKKSDKYC